jgi:outer membrane protein assembly factor BamB
VQPEQKGPKAKAGGGVGGKGLKIAVAVVVVLLLAAGGAAVSYEMSAKKELDATLEVAREFKAKSKFLDARRGVLAFIDKSLSPKQKDRAAAFLKEVEADQQNFEKGRKEAEDEVRREALQKMEALASEIEDDRQNRPSNALQKARELREYAEKHKSTEYMKKAEEAVQSLEKYLGDAFALKAKADGLEKEGKFRDAALLVDKLLSEYPNTDPARNALFPIEVATRPAGVRVTSVRSGYVLGETTDAPVRYRMKPAEPVRLRFEKQGYASVESDVKDKSVGRIQVELVEKREQWILPLGVSVTTPPVILGDALYVAGGSRVFGLKTNPKRMDWYEPLDGPIEGGVKAGSERIFVGTTAQGLYALDPKLPGKKTVWRYEAGERISGTPGLSADGETVYIGTHDRMLHAMRASTGDGLWKREIPADVRVEPIAVEGMVIVACTDGTILALKGGRPEDEVWKFRIDGQPGPMTLEGALFVSGSDNTLFAIDPQKGTKLWSRVLPSNVTGRVACVSGTVCAAVREGKVHFLNASTGATLWTYEAQSVIQGGVSVAGSLVLFGTDDQFVHAFDLSLRSLAWRLKVKGKVKLAPVPGKGAAYVATDEGITSVELN